MKTMGSKILIGKILVLSLLIIAASLVAAAEANADPVNPTVLPVRANVIGIKSGPSWVTAKQTHQLFHSAIALERHSSQREALAKSWELQTHYNQWLLSPFVNRLEGKLLNFNTNIFGLVGKGFPERHKVIWPAQTDVKTQYDDGMHVLKLPLICHEIGSRGPCYK